MKIIIISIALTLMTIGGLVAYLFRPLKHEPKPAKFSCLKIEDGEFLEYKPQPENIYGMGLTYSGHIKETSAEFNPFDQPPIFLKRLDTIARSGTSIPFPDEEVLKKEILQIESNIDFSRVNEFDPLLDYEVELGFVLLEDISRDELNTPNYSPKIGFILANDVSSRFIGVLGEGLENKMDYWGSSKSLENFLPISNKIWIPKKIEQNGIPCIKIETEVNGEIRQSEISSQMMFTPKQMLTFITKKYKNTNLKKGDIVLMGTPGGVAISSPRYLVRLAGLLNFDRFKKLNSILKKDRTRFLKKGDIVKIKGSGFEDIQNKIE